MRWSGKSCGGRAPGAGVRPVPQAGEAPRRAALLSVPSQLRAEPCPRPALLDTGQPAPPLRARQGSACSQRGAATPLFLAARGGLAL